MGVSAERFVVPPPAEFFCEVCNNVLESPTQTSCGHCFCDICVRKSISEDGSCPACKQELTTQDTQPLITALRNILNSMLVRCSYEGCTESCELGRIREHEAGCALRPTSCTNHGCGTNLPFKLLHTHLQACPFRQIKCPRGCNETIIFSEIPDHDKVCTFVPVPCTAGCAELVVGHLMEQHLSTVCPLTDSKCKFFGCDFVARRGDAETWETHNKSSVNAHSILLCKNFSKHATRAAELQSFADQQQNSIQSLSTLLRTQRLRTLQLTMSENNTVTWVIPDFVGHWTLPDGVITSPDLTFSNMPNKQHRYAVQLAVSPNIGESGKLGISVSVVYAPNSQELDWPMQNTMTVRCVNTRGGTDVVKNLSVANMPEFKRARLNFPGQRTTPVGWSDFLTRDEVESGCFLHNNCLVVQCTLDGNLFL